MANHKRTATRTSTVSDAISIICWLTCHWNKKINWLYQNCVQNHFHRVRSLNQLFFCCFPIWSMEAWFSFWIEFFIEIAYLRGHRRCYWFFSTSLRRALLRKRNSFLFLFTHSYMCWHGGVVGFVHNFARFGSRVRGSTSPIHAAEALFPKQQAGHSQIIAHKVNNLVGLLHECIT